jgi:imidazolonepropionase-like amidohydrolase
MMRAAPLAVKLLRLGGKRVIHKVLALAVVLAVLITQPVRSARLQSPASIGAVLFEGARLIPGDGRQPVENSAMLVENGSITRVGVKGSISAPRTASRVDLTGKTIMPPLINTHGHPGFQRGLTYSAENFTRETLIEDLNRALYFGVAVVQSQGIEKGEVTYQIRADQEAGRLGGARLLIAGRGIGAPNAGPGAAAYAGIAYEVTTEDQARRAVQELAAKNVNLIKIWVDDRNGRAPRLAPNLYRAIIDEGHRHRLFVNAHVYYHTDAVDLVNAGIDGFAHLVRDKEMEYLRGASPLAS